MQAWVINLDFRQDRYNSFLNRIKNEKGIIPIRYSAVGSQFDDNDNISTDDVTLTWDTTLNSIFDTSYIPSRIKDLSKGERCCAMSHLNLWRKVIEYNLPYAIIFEDDVILRNNISHLIEEYLKILPLDWDIFLLDYKLGVYPVKSININPKLFKNIYSWFTTGYIISNQGAKKLTNLLPINCSIDNFIAKHTLIGNINSYIPIPKLAHHNSSSSNISHT